MSRVMEIEELDRVALAKPQPAHGLDAGDLGTVVAVHQNGRGFTIEFVALDGATIAILTLPADAIRPVGSGEVAHARQTVVSAT